MDLYLLLGGLLLGFLLYLKFKLSSSDSELTKEQKAIIRLEEARNSKLKELTQKEREFNEALKKYNDTNDDDGGPTN